MTSHLTILRNKNEPITKSLKKVPHLLVYTVFYLNIFYIAALIKWFVTSERVSSCEPSPYIPMCYA